jgi:hypothetical protein
MASDGSERMTEIVTMLSVIGELLAVLTANLASATADEIPALCEEAEKLAQRVVECCMDTAPVDHLPREEVTELRADLHELAEALQAQIANTVHLCLTQITGGVASRTAH